MNSTGKCLIAVAVLLLFGAGESGLCSDFGPDAGWTPLHFAVYSNKGIQELLRSGADVNAKDKEDGDTPLHLASEHAIVAAAKILLTNGALVTATKHARGVIH